jgi:hypothetical protein
MTGPTPTQAPPSVWEDLLEIFYAPGAVFERRRDTPAFGLALLVFVVTAVVLAIVFQGLMTPIFDAEFKRGIAQAMQQNPSLTDEQVLRIKEFAHRFAIPIVGAMSLVIPLLLGLVVWLVGRVVGATTEVGQAMMIGVYGYFPRLLENLVTAAQLLVLPDEAITSHYSVTLGIGRFLNVTEANPVLVALLGRVDLFTVWVTILLALGLAVTGRLSKGQAVAAAAMLWVAGALGPLWGTLRAM